MGGDKECPSLRDDWIAVDRWRLVFLATHMMQVDLATGKTISEQVCTKRWWGARRAGCGSDAWSGMGPVLGASISSHTH